MARRKTVTMTAPAGTWLMDAAKEAIKIAKNLKATVVFDFNGRTIKVNSKSSWVDAMEQFDHPEKFNK